MKNRIRLGGKFPILLAAPALLGAALFATEASIAADPKDPTVATTAGEEAAAPSLAVVFGAAEKLDPFGEWLAAGVDARSTVGEFIPVRAEDREADAEVPRQVASEDTGFDLKGILRRLGDELFALPARLRGTAEKPDEVVASEEAEPLLESAEMEPATTEPVEPATTEPMETVTTEPTETVTVETEDDVAVETTTAAISVGTTAPVVALEEAPSPQPSAAELADRAPRSLGMLNLSTLTESAPVAEPQVVRLSPGSLGDVIGATAPETPSVPEVPLAAEERLEIPDTGNVSLTLAALTPEPPAIEPPAPEARMLAAPTEQVETPEQPSFNLAGLVRIPPPEVAAPRVTVKQRRTPPRPRLRPFDAASQGIRVTPGSSAASLARMLQDVSNRPANAGFAPALTASDRRMSFDQLLSQRGNAGYAIGAALAGGAKAPAAGGSNRSLTTAAKDLRFVLTTEGAYLD